MSRGLSDTLRSDAASGRCRRLGCATLLPRWDWQGSAIAAVHGYQSGRTVPAVTVGALPLDGRARQSQGSREDVREFVRPALGSPCSVSRDGSAGTPYARREFVLQVLSRCFEATAAQPLQGDVVARSRRGRVRRSGSRWLRRVAVSQRGPMGARRRPRHHRDFVSPLSASRAARRECRP